MGDHIQQAIESLEQEIEAIEQRRGELLRAIDAMRPLAGDATPARKIRKSKRAAKRTNERTKQAARHEVGASEPP